MPGSRQIAIAFASLSGASGVALGALGAHQLRPELIRMDTLATWQTAVQYQLLHSVVLLVLAGLATGANRASRLLDWSLGLFAAGIVLFSGSLYGLAWFAAKGLGWVTPIGGLCFMAGWLVAGLAWWRQRV